MPTKDNVTKIINSATEKYCCIFTILAEIGAEPHELECTPRNLIDQQQGIISIQGHKGHLSGTYKLTNQTVEMLRKYLSKHTEEYPFPKSAIMGQVWGETRERAIQKYSQPDLKKIPLKNLRNYSGGQLYYKLLDPLAVKAHLRHKKLETTMHYLSGMPQTNNEEEWTVKIASTKEEAINLIEQGFINTELTFNGETIKAYKKRK
jgi:hypothetical protein